MTEIKYLILNPNTGMYVESDQPTDLAIKHEKGLTSDQWIYPLLNRPAALKIRVNQKLKALLNGNDQRLVLFLGTTRCGRAPKLLANWINNLYGSPRAYLKDCQTSVICFNDQGQPVVLTTKLYE